MHPGEQRNYLELMAPGSCTHASRRFPLRAPASYRTAYILIGLHVLIGPDVLNLTLLQWIYLFLCWSTFRTRWSRLWLLVSQRERGYLGCICIVEEDQFIVGWAIAPSSLRPFCNEIELVKKVAWTVDRAIILMKVERVNRI